MNILITGATSGIGYQLAQDYAKQGHTVIACGRNQEALDELFQFKDLVTPFTQFSLDTNGPYAVLSYDIESSLVERNLHVHYDLVASTIVSVANAVIGAGLRLQKVRFVHQQPDYLEDYHRVFGRQVEFGCQRN